MSRSVILPFSEVCRLAGFTAGADGRLNLPVQQETVDALTRAAAEALLPWRPGDDYIDVTLTGPGPIWAYLAVAHGLHGVGRSLTYAAPNAAPVVIWRHGTDALGPIHG
jgi:hypothetical protein